MALTTIYALGLRLGEGLHLQSSHIDSARQMVWVRSGKGAKDRRVPLPKPLLHKLRQYWKNERPASTLPLLFVSAEGKPIHETTLQKTFTAAQEELNLPRRATIHTLRHSYATHLVEHGIWCPVVRWPLTLERGLNHPPIASSTWCPSAP